MSEQWKRIPGNREIYEISSSGIIRTTDRIGARGYHVAGRILSQHENSNGYLRCNMNIEGKPKSYLVHRLVARCFIPNPEGKPFVNHKDGNKHNNSVENLEWCTKSENELHAHRIGIKKTTPLKGELHGGRIFDWDTIRKIRAEYVKGSETHGQCALARKYGTSQSHIYNIINNKNWIEE